MQALNNKKARSENSSKEQNKSKPELLTMFLYFFSTGWLAHYR